jgi:hypothetical protein
MKVGIMITIEEGDINLARSIAISRGLTWRGGAAGPELRGNIAALFRELVREESDRIVTDRVEQDKTVVGGRDD